jgi:hypothetical protein
LKQIQNIQFIATFVALFNGLDNDVQLGITGIVSVVKLSEVRQ